MALIGKSKRQPGLIAIWLNLLLFGAIVACVTHYFPVLTASAPVQSEVKSSSVENSGALLAEALSTLLNRNIEAMLTDLQKVGEAGAQRVEKRTVPWMAIHPEVLCATFWYENQRWPVRLLAKEFWDILKAQNLNNADQADLVKNLFENQRPLKRSGARGFSMRISKGLLYLRVVDFPQSGAESIELKFDAHRLLSPALSGIPIDHQYQVYNAEQVVLLSNSEDIPAFTGEQWHGPARVWQRFDLLAGGLSLVYGQPVVVATTAKKDMPLIPLLLLGGILAGSLLLAYSVTAHINKPLRELTDEAKLLAQGQFDTVLQASRHPYLDELIRIFNYMGEEMDRFQRINVYEILSDKQKTETMLRNIADGVLVTDAQDRIVIVNKAAEPWFGADSEALTGAHLSKHTPDKALLDLISRVKTEGEVATGEFTLDPPGHRKPTVFQAHAAPFDVEEGKGLGVVTAIRDITKEKEADQIKTELVSMVAHELKSPLTSIYGFSELLLDSDKLDEKGREYAHVILNESNRLTDLINKFLDLARLESGKNELKIMPFDLGQLIRKVAEVHAGQAERKKIRVITQVPDHIPLAQGDQDMIEQVLVNLFSNAVKYSPPQSKIGIEIKSERGMLAVSVIDNGYGIPKESLSRIFEKFYRVVETDALEETEGSGLGLTLAREIIDQHNGAIRVNSRLGVGSVFTFLIPKADIEAVDFEELTL